jgi:hypothetical protein
MGIDEALCQIEACGSSTGDVDSRSEEASIFRLGIDQGVKAARASLDRERERTVAMGRALGDLAQAWGNGHESDEDIALDPFLAVVEGVVEEWARIDSDMLTPGYSTDPPGDGMVTALAALRHRLAIGAWSALNAGRPAELLAQIGAEIDVILASRS